MPDIPAARSDWHAQSVDRVLDTLGTSSAGLSSDEAATRLQAHGPNVLPARRPPTLAAIVLHQFLSPLIYILLAAAAVALVLKDIVDATFILIVVLLNAGLGAFQEWRAEQSASALQRMLQVRSRVRRDGREQVLAADGLVPGDVVLVESGDKVPADLRLLRHTGLRIDESFLTGESLPVEKRIDVVAQDAVVSERTNLAFAGATVMAGRGEGVVIATGLRTEVGAIAETVTASATMKPPLVMRMEKFARQTSVVVLGACLLLAVVGLAQGMAYVDVFFLAVALAVSAIPEGLPVAMTVTLSIATTRMARRNVIVRRLTAVEGLGSCTYIASDKTGTLTVNRQSVRRLALPGGEVLHVSGDGYSGDGQIATEDGQPPPASTKAHAEALAMIGALCNEASLTSAGGEWTHHGDAVDVALLALAYKAGLHAADLRTAMPAVGAVPFESERSYAAVLYERDGRLVMAVKGALEVVLPRCQRMRTGEGVAPIEPERIVAQGDALSGDGHRFLALAEGELVPGRDPGGFGDADISALTLVGLVGLIDPPRPEAKIAVQKCQRAGVEVAMVTGDHPKTALSIARELGIASDERQVCTGATLTALGDPLAPPFQEAVRVGRVFARVAPMQKLQIVEALQQQGHFVAVTGDGVNDAPALKRANIGVAMGSGSDVTKDTAALIVTDDNFASIEAGVEEGRFAYDNIRKVTYLLISTGAAEVVLFVAALLAQLPLPLLPVQLLWLNLVTNGIQDVALAFEGGEPEAMSRPPRRPGEGIFNRLMILQTITAGLTMGGVLFLNWIVLLDAGFTEAEARNRLLLLAVLLQNYHVFNARSEQVSAFGVPLSRNYVLVGGVLLAQAVHLLAMHLPLMQRVLQVGPVSSSEWLVPFVTAGIIIAVMEGFKLLVRRRVIAVS
ncbi:MAG: HAD-IC family P-type ATPase [Acidobacteriota bacterium]|nr:HAD-IC family P-type ATPase [Acidobacteriota bacterium]